MGDKFALRARPIRISTVYRRLEAIIARTFLRRYQVYLSCNAIVIPPCDLAWKRSSIRRPRRVMKVTSIAASDDYGCSC